MRIALFIIFAAPLLAPSAGLGAETSKREEAKKEAAARDSFRDGVSYYEKGRFADALAAFKQAYSIRPSYKILFNIGQVQAMLDNNAAALEAFEGYVAEGREEMGEKRLEEVEREMARLASLVGELSIDGPRGAELWIDGERRGYLPLAGPLRLDAGEHLVVVRSSEELVCEKHETIPGGAAVSSRCEPPQTAPEPPAVAAETAAPTPEPTPAEEARAITFAGDVAPWTVAGLGAATLAAAIVCAAKAASLNGELQDSCPGGSCPPNRADDVERLPKLAGAADGLFVATAVLGAVAVTLFAAPWRDRDRKEAKP